MLLASTPLLRTTTGTQNPSGLAAVVSFGDDYIKWGRIEVSWWGRVLCRQVTDDTPPSRSDFLLSLPVLWWTYSWTV